MKSYGWLWKDSFVVRSTNSKSITDDESMDFSFEHPGNTIWLFHIYISLSQTAEIETNSKLKRVVRIGTPITDYPIIDRKSMLIEKKHGNAPTNE